MAVKKTMGKVKSRRKVAKPAREVSGESAHKQELVVEVKELEQICTGKLSDGSTCTKIIEKGKTLCRWHDPQDQSWWETFEQLQKATSEERTNIILELIEDHPEHWLVLPKRSERSAYLSNLNLSRETLERRKAESRIESPAWWSIKDNGAQLQNADLQGAILNDANLQGVNLASANLQGAHLQNVNLQDAYLHNANFKKAILLNANFQNAYLRIANLEDARLGAANFQGANLHQANLQNALLAHADLKSGFLREANFQDADLSFANLRDTNLVQSNLKGANLAQSNLTGASLVNADLQDADLRGATLRDVNISVIGNISNIYISGAWLDRNRMRHEQFDNAIGEELDQNYIAARAGYLMLKQNFYDLGDYDGASWAYRKERRMEKLEARENGRKALSKQKWRRAVTGYLKYYSDSIVEGLCDYGESVWRVIGWIIVLIFVAGPILFSSLGGIHWNKEVVSEYFDLSSSDRFWLWYRIYLLYTLDTMTTSSFSGLQPINDKVKLASGCFAIAGIFLAGLWGFVAGNRIRRS
jgi:uncharacterized protein YjbI with pentapeptide repeats